MIPDHWLDIAARAIHDDVCGCGGHGHVKYYLNLLRKALR